MEKNQCQRGHKTWFMPQLLDLWKNRLRQGAIAILDGAYFSTANCGKAVSSQIVRRFFMQQTNQCKIILLGWGIVHLTSSKRPAQTIYEMLDLSRQLELIKHRQICQWKLNIEWQASPSQEKSLSGVNQARVLAFKKLSVIPRPNGVAHSSLATCLMFRGAQLRKNKSANRGHGRHPILHHF